MPNIKASYSIWLFVQGKLNKKDYRYYDHHYTITNME